MGQLSTELRPKLARLVPLLGSDKPGEVAATVAAIERTLVAARCDWHDLAAALVYEPEPGSRSSTNYTRWPPRWSSSNRFGIMNALRAGADGGHFNAREAEFAYSVADQIQLGSCRFTDRQIAWLDVLLTKLNCSWGAAA